MAALVVWKNFNFLAPKSSEFQIRYGIDVSHLKDLRLQDAKVAYSDIIQHLCSSGLSLDWVDFEAQVKQRFIQEGRLVSSEIVFEPSNQQILILTSWRDKASFYAYYSETQLYKLDDAFQSAGLRPRIFNTEAIFPQSAAAKWS